MLCWKELNMNKYKIGTLVEDGGRVGIISAFYPIGCETFNGAHKINWQDNYEIHFASNITYVIGIYAFHRLVTQGQIKIIGHSVENKK